MFIGFSVPSEKRFSNFRIVGGELHKPRANNSSMKTLRKKEGGREGEREKE